MQSVAPALSPAFWAAQDAYVRHMHSRCLACAIGRCRVERALEARAEQASRELTTAEGGWEWL